MDSETFVPYVEQLRVNMGISQGGMGQRIGRANGNWGAMMRKHREGVPNMMTLRTATKILAIFGLCLYVGRIGEDTEE